ATEGKEVKETKPTQMKLGKSEIAFRVLAKPRLTEKASLRMANNNEYVFVVYPDASKHSVKKAVQELYGVQVAKIQIINIPAKQIRFRKSVGWKSGYKKAIVQVQPGQKIEGLSA
ncbi:MAG: 50S ribosomal protein L23, partial [Candidatus Wildermuthbacteria bacterium]|nr:50S ribosomal protein L23 [Candidatus Wildermuthbacteria bacterium]